MRLQGSKLRASSALKTLGSALLPILVAGAVVHGPRITAAAGAPGNYSLVFSGDATFQGPHGGQPIHVTLETTDGKRVASDEGTVSGTADPAFSFDFGNVLQPGQSYVIKYWIDSNFGGGTEGECDGPSHDHQWEIGPSENAALGNVSGNVTIVDSHRPSDVQAVCGS